MRPTIKGAAALAAISAAAMAVTPLASAASVTPDGPSHVENANSNAISDYSAEPHVIPGVISRVTAGNIYGADRIATSLQALTAFSPNSAAELDGVGADNFGPVVNSKTGAEETAKNFIKAALAIKPTFSGYYSFELTPDRKDGAHNTTDGSVLVDLYIVSTKNIVDALSLAPISRGNGSGGFVVYANQDGLDSRGFDRVSKLISYGAVRRVFIVGGYKALSSRLEDQVYEAAMAAKARFLAEEMKYYNKAASRVFTGIAPEELAFYAQNKEDVYKALAESAAKYFDSIHFARLDGADRFDTAYKAGAWAVNYAGVSKAYEGIYVTMRDAIAERYANDQVAKANAARSKALNDKLAAETTLVNAATSLSINKDMILNVLNPNADLVAAINNLPTTESIQLTSEAEAAKSEVTAYVKAASDFKNALADLYKADAKQFDGNGNKVDSYLMTTNAAPAPATNPAPANNPTAGPAGYNAELSLNEIAKNILGTGTSISNTNAPDTAKFDKELDNAKRFAKAFQDAYNTLISRAADGTPEKEIGKAFTSYVTNNAKGVTSAISTVSNLADQTPKSFLYQPDPKGTSVKLTGMSVLTSKAASSVLNQDVYKTTVKTRIINFAQISSLANYLLEHSATYANDARALLNASNDALAATKELADANAKLKVAEAEAARVFARSEADIKTPFYQGSPVKYGEALKSAYANNVQAVFFATGENFADALTAGPAAASMPGGVVLLTPGKTFNQWDKYAAYLSRNNASYYAVGGAAAEAAKADGLTLKDSYVGKDRYETSVKLNNGVFGTGKSLYLVASGETGADSVVAGAYQATINNYGDKFKDAMGGIILTAKSELPAAADNFFKSLRWGFQSAAFFGGNGVITNDVRAQVLTDMGASQAVLNNYISNNTFGYAN